MKRHPELNGAWEERGVIGTRIEIDGSDIVIMWRNSPVLETKFSTGETDDGRTVLNLRENGLRYVNASSDYANVTSIYFKEGRLYFEEFFPISGKSSAVFDKTENSRFGNFTIVDKEILPILKGKWKSEDGYYEIKISGSDFELNGEKIKIHVLKNNSGYSEGFRIVNEDPAVFSVCYFENMTFDGMTISAIIPVCDAQPVVMRFNRV